jgi:hypothetical protein
MLCYAFGRQCCRNSVALRTLSIMSLICLASVVEVLSLLLLLALTQAHCLPCHKRTAQANDGAQDDRFREHIIRTAHKFEVATAPPAYASTATADAVQDAYPVWVSDTAQTVPYNVPLQLSRLSARPDGVVAALYPIDANSSTGGSSSGSSGGSAQQQQQQHRAVLGGAEGGGELLQRETKWGKGQAQKAWQAQAASVTTMIHMATKELASASELAEKQVLLLTLTRSALVIPLLLLLYYCCAAAAPLLSCALVVSCVGWSLATVTGCYAQ